MATFDDTIGVLFQDLKIRRKHRFIVFSITDLVVKVEKIGHRDEHYEDLLAVIPSSNCRYILYDYEYKTPDKRQSSKLFLIFWKPLNSNDQDKVLYAQTLPKFQESLPGVTKESFSEEDEIEELLKNESF